MPEKPPAQDTPSKTSATSPPPSTEWTTVAPKRRSKPIIQPPHEPRRSGRIRKPIDRLDPGAHFSSLFAPESHLPPSHFVNPFAGVASAAYTNPFAGSAKSKTDPDTLSFDEAMNDVDRDKWIESAQVEISALEAMGCWDEVPIEDAQSKIIPGTFVFRRKRTPDGEIKKYKGRFCVRGDLQEDVEDTFAPVVSWSTTRTVLILSILWGWVTASVDFSNAFVHAYLKKPIWIHLPRGFRSKHGPNTCLRLRRSLYGTQIAPKLWYEACSDALLELGFTQSKYDQCLFYKPNMLVVVYVDDAIICAKTDDLVEELIRGLRSKGFTLTREGTFAEYLGIKFESRADGALILTQRGLIEKIITATGLEDANPNWLPATQLALGPDVDGDRMTESWKYSSIVGMLLYVSCNTRPDIAFAVSQVCRYSANPKQSHAIAVKTIVRYLSRTRDKGMILRPSNNGSLQLDLYVDADFCGLHRRGPDHDPNSAKSRMGYIIMLNDCPVFWKSQLISHVCLSTLESEYASASQALRTLLPLKRLLEEIVEALSSKDDVGVRVLAKVFEDNQGALLLARDHRITARTKYFLVKWHWFWSFSDEISFVKVESANQRADFLTKGLPRPGFEHNRRLTMGW